ncbi:MAG: response regulator [Nitrospira sp.]|nr:response regulator [Nitrospira sp.]
MMSGYEKHVLVADNEKLVGRRLADHPVARHIAVVAVTDGLQALRELHHHHFDAVIAVPHLRYLDGFDLLCQCHLVWPQLPVIFISGNLLDDVGPAMAQGAYACLHKSVDTVKLIHVLSEAIARPGDPRSSQVDMLSDMLEAQQRWAVCATDTE